MPPARGFSFRGGWLSTSWIRRAAMASSPGIIIYGITVSEFVPRRDDDARRTLEQRLGHLPAVRADFCPRPN